LIPNNCLTGIACIGQTTQIGACGRGTAGQYVRGTAMAATDIIIAVGIFVLGAAIGLVVVVSIGIRHEERLFRERRRLAEEESVFLGRPVPYQGLMDTAPDLVSHGARALTGLRLRRARSADSLVVPEYERQH
jgi:hypothetical protein